MNFLVYTDWKSLPFASVLTPRHTFTLLVGWKPRISLISEKSPLKNFSNVSGLEAIARNNLKMSGEDEVLVIINTPKEEEKEEKPKHIGLKKHD